MRTKPKLSYLLAVINFATINLFVMMVLYFGIKDSVKKFRQFVLSSKYVKQYGASTAKTAPADQADNFDRIISEFDLSINSKKVGYGAFAEKKNVAQVNYDLALCGRYLSFINYLKTLVQKNLLYKVNSLSLRVKSLEEIDIKINIEALYESK